MVDPHGDFDASDSESSEHASGPSSGRKTKRRRLHGACDTCRKKKIKCDSAIAPNNFCSNCLNSKVQCTHNIPRQKKKDTQQEYIRSLEEKLRRMEEQLNLANSAHSPQSESSRASSELRRDSASPSHRDTFPGLPLPVPRSAPDFATELTPPPAAITVKDEEDEKQDLIHVALSERIRDLSMNSVEDRFFGSSSLFSFAQQAVTLRQELGGVPPCNFQKVRRPYFWKVRDWEKDFLLQPLPKSYVYPDPDLLASLISLFFERVHPIYPAVHRPTFLREVESKKHLSDPGFGMVVLAVCALGARFSDDPRIFTRPLDPEQLEGSGAGWKYVTQVPIWRNTLCDRTTMYDLQFYALAAKYYLGSSMPQITWTLTGLGLRLAQERGLHRRKGPNFKPTLTDEIEKRVFWCLICHDRIQGSFLGRPPSLHDEDIDCDYPVECDDEYWEAENPEDAFKQPEGKVCYAAAFTWTLKLNEIIGFMARTLYSTKKSKILSGLVGDEWEIRVVTELDSSLNKWKDSLPKHLVWDPANPDQKLFSQSLFLHCTFCYTQIQVHRPFLARGDSPLAMSSRAICTNAARSCSLAAEVSLKRHHWALVPNVMMAAFISAMVLTVNFWTSRAFKTAYDPVREMADIERCRAFMAEGEKRWFVAGRLRDMITEFSIIRGPSLVQKEVGTAKRSRSDTEIPQYQPQAPAVPVPPPAMLNPQYPPYLSRQHPLKQQQLKQQQYPQQIYDTTPRMSQYPIGYQQQQQYGQVTADMRTPRASYPVLTAEQCDLSSLLLAQMGYDQLPGNNFPVTTFPNMVGHQGNTDIQSNLTYQQPVQQPVQQPMNTHPDYQYGTENHHPPQMMGVQGLPQGDPDEYADSLYDMSMWLSTTKALSLEEWEAYLATMEGPMPVTETY
ncbi:hypothetical protein D9611_003877 [Ephemerocybe angulata]|uniref:Zn(2)-C6 fungal-type domain-containing protein n=1 Tax=Ephemerocybe angulata TaxID=980116 RepID=A0A8H5B566_9AGAR|nr:hypothetical protein D9611_003877 [Tulosesus angulatus]